MPHKRLRDAVKSGDRQVLGHALFALGAVAGQRRNDEHESFSGQPATRDRLRAASGASCAIAGSGSQSTR